MPILALAVLAIGALSIADPVRAQAWDPAYPVCMRVAGPFNYNECRFGSLAQCAAAASGRAAECMPNPYFARASGEPARRYRRHRGIH
jgi:hypothetical protein